ETELHRDDMIDLIQTLQDRFADEDRVCVSGNMLLFYEEGNRRKHVSPDVFMVRGVEKKRRDHYLVWKEGRAPDLVIEITSKSTRREDQTKKWEIYRTILRVSEYILFDPTEDYLKPPLQGFRLVGDDYVPIELVDGRLPSAVLGLHFERVGDELRLFDPVTGTHLLKRAEQRDDAKGRAEAERQRAEAERQRAEVEQQRAEAERQRAEAERQRAETVEAVREQLAEENERLRRELEALRRAAGGE
ncbi:MAG TPA: Uma2 family endonuclease, partial [Isosphaeraceae bacterium]|nr:Uma2 family endonuclease [Isosphaeraceae bacterium]